MGPRSLHDSVHHRVSIGDQHDVRCIHAGFEDISQGAIESDDGLARLQSVVGAFVDGDGAVIGQEVSTDHLSGNQIHGLRLFEVEKAAKAIVFDLEFFECTETRGELLVLLQESAVAIFDADQIDVHRRGVADAAAEAIKDLAHSIDDKLHGLVKPRLRRSFLLHVNTKERERHDEREEDNLFEVDIEEVQGAP